MAKPVEFPNNPYVGAIAALELDLTVEIEWPIVSGERIAMLVYKAMLRETEQKPRVFPRNTIGISYQSVRVCGKQCSL